MGVEAEAGAEAETEAVSDLFNFSQISQGKKPGRPGALAATLK
jgi:hypothetical protein